MFQPDALPAELGAALDQVRQLPVEGATGMSPQERAVWLVGLQQMADAVQAASLQVLAAFDAAGDGEALHAARSSAAWLRGALGIAGGDAATRVRLARGSRHELRQVLKRLRRGDVTYDQVKVIGRATRTLPEQHVPAAAELLTELATQTDVAGVVQASKHLATAIDPDGALTTNEQDYTRRRLTLSPMLDGMVAVDGLLDAEAAATVTIALHPFLVPSGADDHRTTPQRRADGLVALAHAAMTQAVLPISGGTRPSVNVVTTLESLTGHRDPVRSRRQGSVPPGSSLLEQTPGGGGVVGSLATQRLACDAAVARVLLTPDGVPVDLGHSQRLFSPHQRKLLALRDGGCRFPGCGLPPAFTDAHHLVPWQHGGATDLDNALLVCRHHHRTLHESGWHAVAQDRAAGAHGPICFTPPDGPPLTTAPRNLNPSQGSTLTWWSHPPPGA